MLQDVVYPPEQLQIEENMSSPIAAAHMFDFCDPNLFPENLQNSEVSSCSGCCNDDASYTNDLSVSSFPLEIASFNDPTTAPAAASNNLTLRDSQTENKTDVSASINFPSSMPMSPQNQVSSAFSALPYIPTHNDHFDLASMQIPLADVEVSGFSHYSSDSVVPLGTGPSLEAVFEEDAFSSMPPSYVRMDPASPSSSFLDCPGRMGGYLPGSLNGGIYPDISGIFQGNIIADSGLTSQELEFHGDYCGVYCSDSVYCSGELQVISESQQQMIKSSCGSPVGLTSDMSNLDEQGGFGKAPRLTLEERKVKIHRYMKKRNERNFSKKIKYACRKTLADSRPRVRGRFAKNDEFGEAAKPSGSNHEEELDEDEREGMVVKDELMLDSSDILAHISGVNSFKRNFPIPSWV